MNMNTFKEFQFATIIFAILIPIHIFITYAYLMQMGTHPMPASAFVLVNVSFVLVYILFYGMTTVVDQDRVRLIFGVGLIHITVKLSDVQSVEVVSNPWYYGWGIRLIPNGMLYNVKGKDGVEVRLKNTARIIRIGSTHASALKDAIQHSAKSFELSTFK
ncbi:MAG: hypothetical protein QM762_04225 [Chryseolinea sp.]